MPTKGQQLDTRGHRHNLQAELLDRLVVVDPLAELDDVIDDRHADRLSHEQQQTEQETVPEREFHLIDFHTVHTRTSTQVG